MGYVVTADHHSNMHPPMLVKNKRHVEPMHGLVDYYNIVGVAVSNSVAKHGYCGLHDVWL